jgi:alpha-L-fucosidase
MTDRHAEYQKYIYGQLKELLSNYGRTDMIFFDGLGGDAKRFDAENLFKMIRTLQPHVMINDRCGLPADNDTPEQEIGKMQTDRPWETCMTIGDQWSWKPDDNIKSLKTCLQTLVKVVCGDGNLLFNVGPMPDGRIEPRQVEILKKMGQWLNNCGESIYNTRGGPFLRSGWGGSTFNGKTIYVHILDPKLDTVVLPPISGKIVSNSVLTGGTATVKQTEEGIEISLPQADRQEIDTIVALKLDVPVGDIKVLRAKNQSLAAGKKAAASNVYRNMENEYGPQQAFDDNSETRWATDEGTHRAWLEVDLGEPMSVEKAMIAEADFGSRVQKFELQAKIDGQWKTFYAGTTLGDERRIKFDPVTAQVFRLNILEATEGPTIKEFQLFAEKSGDPAALQGIWVARSMEIDGKPVPDEDLKHMRFDFQGDSVIVRGNHNNDEEETARYSIAPHKSPKEIEIAPLKEKNSILGIYELKDDELKLCLRHASSHKGRPTEFSTKPDTQLVLLSLKKQPK